MPTYTLQDLKTGQQHDVVCSWNELQKMLDEQQNVKHVLSAPKIVSGVSGNRDLKVPDGFKDLLKNKVKKGSGRGNTVNV